MIAVVAGVGLSGTSWFDRSHAGFAQAQSLFGGNGLSADTLGTITLLLIPVQLLLIVVAMRAFAQGWNVEQEVPIEEARRRGYNPPTRLPLRASPRPPEPPGELVAAPASTLAFEAPLPALRFVLGSSRSAATHRILRPRAASTSGTSRCDRTYRGRPLVVRRVGDSNPHVPKDSAF